MTEGRLSPLVVAPLLRNERRRAVAASPGRYGLASAQATEVETRSGLVIGFSLRVGFIPDQSGGTTTDGVPPDFTPTALLLTELVPRAPDPQSIRARIVEVCRDATGIDLRVTLSEARPNATLGPRLFVQVDRRRLPDVDPMFDAAEFSLGLTASQGAPAATGDLAPDDAPINYLAKDWNGFVAVMQERLRITAPLWVEKNPADVGQVLVELMAQAADYLSYFQDGVATEAYLLTARRRASLRRHARLLDYAPNESANARAWLHVATDADDFFDLPAGTPFATVHTTAEEDRATDDTAASPNVFFETLRPQRIYRAHNEIALYDWGAPRAALSRGADMAAELRDEAQKAGDLSTATLYQAVSLRIADHAHAASTKGTASALAYSPLRHADEATATVLDAAFRAAQVMLAAGATEAMLVGHVEDLHAGDVVVFECLHLPGAAGPVPAPAHLRHAVRLTSEPEWTKVWAVTGAEDPVTRITWTGAEALPFAVPVGRSSDGRVYSLLRGNMVLADEGCSVRPPVPPIAVDLSMAGAYSVPLRGATVAWAEPIMIAADGPRRSRLGTARAALFQDPRATVPCVRLVEERPDGRRFEWTPRRDLLASRSLDRHYVPEVEDSDVLWLRFGDGVFGRKPAPGSRLFVAWRLSAGTGGNVGHDAVCDVIARDGDSDDIVIERLSSPGLAVRNLLPAEGATVAESDASIRQDAPQAYRRQERCVTEEDFARLAERVPGVRAAAARFVWNGRRRVAMVHVQADDTGASDDELFAAVKDYLAPRRIAGLDFEVLPPVWALVHVRLRVKVRGGLDPGSVLLALYDELGHGKLDGGRAGLFFRGPYGFGQPVYLAPIVARAAGVTGVEAVRPVTFQRWAGEDRLDAGAIFTDATEIAAVQGDPSLAGSGAVEIELDPEDGP